MTNRDDTDAVWNMLRREVFQKADAEAILASYLHSVVLDHRSLEDALSYLLAGKLSSPYMSAVSLREISDAAFHSSPDIQEAIRRDLSAVANRDPAARGVSEPFLHYKGFHAIEAYRVSHWLWSENRQSLALYYQNRISEVFAVDIHPGARIGKGILIDHGTGVVIGETAVVGDDVSMLHEVTLGGTGKETGDRHPKVGKGVLIGAGAKILGNVRIGEGAKIGAGSVVLNDVPAHTTVAGVPAKIIGAPHTEAPALIMNQNIELDVDAEQGPAADTDKLRR